MPPEANAVNCFAIFAQLKINLLKKLLFIHLLLLPVFIFAQSYGSLTVFSENGDKFFLYLDGKKQNEHAYSNIRVQDLPDLYYAARIEFEEKSLAPFTKNNLYISDGEDIMMDASYRIRREKSGKPKLVFFSMKAVQQNFIPPSGMFVVKYGQPSEDVIPAEPVKKEPALVNAAGLGSLTVFSQNGDKFFLFLDGVKQNEEARSDIRVQQIPGLYYNAKIVFKNASLPPIVKNNLYISDGEDVLMDAAYRLRRDKTGKPKLNFYSMKTVQPNFIPAPGLFVYNFGNPDVIAGSSKPEVPKKAVASNVKGSISNIKITNVDDKPKASVKPPTAKTVKKPIVDKPSVEIKAAAPVKSIPPKTIYNKEAESVKIEDNKKCNGWPMGKADLAAALKAVEAAGKDEDKLITAKELITSNCLLVSQVKEFCVLFKTEKTKLAFAKFAYKFTSDKKNYTELQKLFSQETNRKELEKFITGG